MSEDKTKQMSNIQAQIATLKDKIAKINTETKKQIEKRDELNNKTKQTNQEINGLRAKRDEINQKVKELKQQRNEIHQKIKPIMDEIRAINEKKQEIRKNAPPIRRDDVQKEIDAIDWKIQTETLDMKEEKRLVDEIKQLEKQLGGFKKIDKENKKIDELLSQRKALDALADNFHKQLSELVKAGQDVHAKVIAKVDAAKQNRAEADLMHKAFIESKEKIQQVQVEIAVLTGQLNGLRDAYRAERAESRALRDKEYEERAAERAKEKELINIEKTKRAQSEQQLKEKIGAQAKEKLERGEEVNFAEFAMLAGDDEEEHA
ncbi:MAG: hypothetical protein NWF01_07265 [Candidatus Bathyarchaeota archaeon]|nr:hypothetical protein [Candidatus Bathyarchaeota archaeon]